MGDFDEYIGMRTATGTLVVERAPISAFAAAVSDANPIYRNAEAARDAGFADIPAPPTFGFSIQNWGAWEELQPSEGRPERNPMAEVMGGLMAKGGMVLHGEQSFTFHHPVTVGMRLDFDGVVTDIYAKESGDRTMTFMVIEDTYRDAATGDVVLTSVMNLIHRS